MKRFLLILVCSLIIPACSEEYKFPNQLVELDYLNQQATLTPAQWIRRQRLNRYQGKLEALKTAYSGVRKNAYEELSQIPADPELVGRLPEPENFHFH